MPHEPICENSRSPFPPGADLRNSNRSGWKLFWKRLAWPETKLQFVMQAGLYSALAGAMLGVVAAGPPIYVAVFIAVIQGYATLPVSRYFVMREGAYYLRVFAILAGIVAGTSVAMFAAELTFGHENGGAHWSAAFSAALLMNMVYAGMALEHRRARKNKLMAEESQMRLLQTQINPHFMSNTLANVSALIDSDPPAAQNLLDELVSFMSDLAHYSRQDMITLADALDSFETHMEIHRIRAGERLTWSTDVAPELHWQPLLPLIVLPLVENAVIHGVNTVPGEGWVRLSASSDETAGKWSIAISNNGKRDLDKSAAGHGIAITNIRERLAMRYGTAASLELFWLDAHTHCARVTLPLVKNPRGATEASP